VSDAARVLAEAAEQHRRDLLEPWPLSLTTGEVMDIKAGLSDAIGCLSHHYQGDRFAGAEVRSQRVREYTAALYALDRRFVVEPKGKKL